MATATKTKKQSAVASSGLMDLGIRSKAKKTASRSTVVKVSDARTAKLIGQLIAAKREKKEAESACAILEGELTDAAHKLRIKQCLSDRVVLKTVKLSGDHGSLSFVQPSRFCAMYQHDCEDHLVAEFGERKYGKYFTVEQFLKINVSKLTEEQQAAIGEILVEALGSEIDDILDPEAKITPTDAYIYDCIFDPKVKASSDKLRSNSCEAKLVEPFKASFRL